jgi:hypothetical protein
MVRAADAMMQAANPTLFEISMKYFPETVSMSGPPRLFRLTRTQLDATTQLLLPMQFKGSAVDALPRDPLQTNYEYADNLSFNPANFTPYTSWVAELAAGVRTNPASVIDCAAKNNAANCLDEQARVFVKRAFRNVVTDADLLRFSTLFTASVAETGLPAASGIASNVFGLESLCKGPIV